MIITNQEATEQNKNMTDTIISGMGLGNAQAIQNLTPEKEKPIEEEINENNTHGSITAELEKIAKELETYNADIEWLENFLKTWENKAYIKVKDNDKMETLLEQNIKDYKRSNKLIGKINTEERNKNLNEALENMYNKKSELIDIEKNLKSNPKYDNRTDSQIREDMLRAEQRARDDTAYQRTVNDYRKAGFNPAGLSGVNYGGGGGGSSGSKSEEEEEKKRRKKREQEEEARRKEIILLQLLGMGANIGSTLGGQAMRSAAVKKINYKR